jgi:DNA-directed RNA polymerase subunit RPC12/RpoP
MKRGHKKYRCDECKTESFHHWIELNRASRMRCQACGSTRLELVTDQAKREAAAAQAVRIEGHRDMVLQPMPSRKKVT